MTIQLTDRELKKGSAELLILSLVENRARHGYEIGQLIELRSQGALRFNVASLYPLLYRLEKRGWNSGTMGGKAGPTPASILPTYARRQKNAGGAARWLARIRGSSWANHRN
jgi:Transcriptional regulator PadR-like family